MFSLEGRKSLSGGTPTRAGKARFKLYCCVYIDISVFLPVIPFCLKPWSSRAETEICSWGSDGQGRVGPGESRVQGTGTASSSPQEGAWQAQHGQASHRAKKPFDSKASSAAIQTSEKQTTRHTLHFLTKVSVPEPRGHIQEH